MNGKSKKKLLSPIKSFDVYREINTFIGIFSPLIEISMTPLTTACSFEP
jgi:hypothetical protein